MEDNDNFNDDSDDMELSMHSELVTASLPSMNDNVTSNNCSNRITHASSCITMQIIKGYEPHGDAEMQHCAV